MRRFVEVQHKLLVPSRATSSSFARASGVAFNMIGLHMDPTLAMGEKARSPARLKAQVDKHKQEAIFLLGGLNFRWR